uniref:Uncharacterized protein n=1 Tax=Tetraselmis sp. GSL018 TaxID=582737 RepID=A0A061S5I7_9CHLO|mmetsp:Transcript_18040/g.43214  ORF Transcript_18040/g.43214 Transcript_18040/m.43214 type:complete len:223 (+) Transcript_18040:836-1504(+)
MGRRGVLGGLPDTLHRYLAVAPPQVCEGPLGQEQLELGPKHGGRARRRARAAVLHGRPAGSEEGRLHGWRRQHPADGRPQCGRAARLQPGDEPRAGAAPSVGQVRRAGARRAAPGGRRGRERRALRAEQPRRLGRAAADAPCPDRPELGRFPNLHRPRPREAVWQVCRARRRAVPCRGGFAAPAPPDVPADAPRPHRAHLGGCPDLLPCSKARHGRCAVTAG